MLRLWGKRPQCPVPTRSLQTIYIFVRTFKIWDDFYRDSKNANLVGTTRYCYQGCICIYNSDICQSLSLSWCWPLVLPPWSHRPVVTPTRHIALTITVIVSPISLQWATRKYVCSGHVLFSLGHFDHFLNIYSLLVVTQNVLIHHKWYWISCSCSMIR